LHTFLLNIGFFLLAVSFFIKKNISKHIVLILFAIALFGFGILKKIPIYIFWSALFLLINLFSLVKFFLKKNKIISLDEEIIDIYDNVFFELNKKEFLQIWRRGKVLKSRVGEFLCKQGILQGDIYLLLKGTVAVYRNDEKIAELRRGNFVAEKGYITQKPASADVIAETDIEYILWKRIDFENLKNENPDLFDKVGEILQKGYSH